VKHTHTHTHTHTDTDTDTDTETKIEIEKEIEIDKEKREGESKQGTQSPDPEAQLRALVEAIEVRNKLRATHASGGSVQSAAAAQDRDSVRLPLRPSEIASQTKQRVPGVLHEALDACYSHKRVVHFGRAQTQIVDRVQQRQALQARHKWVGDDRKLYTE
jgi:hypothetical protein